jgi:hypothetical protein
VRKAVVLSIDKKNHNETFVQMHFDWQMLYATGEKSLKLTPNFRNDLNVNHFQIVDQNISYNKH